MPRTGGHVDLVVFVVVAFALPWLMWALRFPPGLVAAGGMASVGLATFLATRLRARTHDWRRDTGLRPFLPLRSTAGQVAIGLGLVMAMGVAAQVLGGLIGAPALDLVGLSGARFAYSDTGPRS